MQGAAQPGSRPFLPPPHLPFAPTLQPTQKKRSLEEAEEAAAQGGPGEKKGSPEGSSDEEGALVIDEQSKEKNNEKAGRKRKAEEEAEEVTAWGGGCLCGPLPSSVPSHQVLRVKLNTRERRGGAAWSTAKVTGPNEVNRKILSQAGRQTAGDPEQQTAQSLQKGFFSDVLGAGS